MRTRRRATLMATAAAVLVPVLSLSTGCGSSAPASRPSPSAASGPRPLTVAEADRLAVMRYLDFQAGQVGFTTTVPAATGAVTVHGSVDYDASTGLGAYQTAAPGSQVGVIAWTPTTVTAWSGIGDGTTAPTARPQPSGVARALRPGNSSFDTVLALLLQLGQDRPDNPQLLQQSDARWIRADAVGSTRVDVFQGPSPTITTSGSAPSTAAVLYWVDARGRLLRLDTSPGGQPVRIDLAGPA